MNTRAAVHFATTGAAHQPGGAPAPRDNSAREVALFLRGARNGGRAGVSQPCRQHPPYSKDEDATIATLFSQGAKWADIADAIKRPPQSVRARAYVLGLKRKNPKLTGDDKPAASTLLNRRFQEKFPEKRRAHKAVEWALLSGTLQKQPCLACGSVDVHAHHPDYSKPLDVRWLCPACHRAEHRKSRVAK